MIGSSRGRFHELYALLVRFTPPATKGKKRGMSRN